MAVLWWETRIRI